MTAKFEHLNLFSTAAQDHLIGSKQQLAEVRRRGWLLELERALLTLESSSHAAGHEFSATVKEIEQDSHANHGQNSDSVLTLSVDISPESRDFNIDAQMVWPRSSVTPIKRELAAGQNHLPHALFSLYGESQAKMEGQLVGDAMPPEIEFVSPAVAWTKTPIDTLAGLKNTMSALTEQEQLFPTDQLDGSNFSEEIQSDLIHYSRRQLHLHRNIQGAQVWIRDAYLTKSDANSILSTLARTLGDAGIRLATLTLNGKKVMDLSNANFRHESEPIVQSDEKQYLWNESTYFKSNQ